MTITSNHTWLDWAEALIQSDFFSPIPVCRPTSEGHCSAPWHPQPCPSAGKRPLVAGYTRFKDEHPCERTLRHWAGDFPASNLGGVVRSGYLVVEADSPEADLELVSLMPELDRAAPCRAPRPGRGRAWVLEAPKGAEATNRAKLGRSGAIDVRGPGGLLVLPPSLHRAGHVVQWVRGRSPFDVSPVPMSGRLRALVLAPAPTLPARGVPRHASAGPVSPKLSPRVKHYLSGHLEFHHLWNGRGKRSGDTSASGYDFSIARYLLKRGLPKHEVADALLARPEVHRRSPEYAIRTVHRAAGGGGR